MSTAISSEEAVYFMHFFVFVSVLYLYGMCCGVQCGCHKNMPSNHGPSRPCRVTTPEVVGQDGDNVTNVEKN